MAEEAKPFNTRIRNRSDVSVVITGIGRHNAEAALLQYLGSATPFLVISSGFAGGLDPSLSRGTVVFDADPESRLAPLLESCGAVPARFHCHSSIVATAPAKRELRRNTQADAVEMESEVIRRLCRLRAIPAATVRVISDEADENLPLDFNRLITADMKMSYPRLAGALVKNPGKIAELMRFQRHIRAAARKLAEVLEYMIDGIRRGI